MNANHRKPGKLVKILMHLLAHCRINGFWSCVHLSWVHLGCLHSCESHFSCYLLTDPFFWERIANHCCFVSVLQWYLFLKLHLQWNFTCLKSLGLQKTTASNYWWFRCNMGHKECQSSCENRFVIHNKVKPPNLLIMYCMENDN